MDYDVYMRAFFSGADLEKRLKLAERVIKVVWGNQWDPNVDPVTDVQVEVSKWLLDLDEETISRGVRYDLLIRTRYAAFFVVEFQKANKYNDAERLIFEAAQILSEQLSKSGQSVYKPLNDIYCTIFTDYKVFKKGPLHYVRYANVEPYNEKVKLPFNLAFVDVRYKDKNTPLGRLNWDLTQEDSDELLDPLFRERGKEMENPIILKTYEDEYAHELYEVHMRAVEKAKWEEKVTMIMNMFNVGIPVDQIALCSNLTVEEVNDIVAQSPKATPTDAATA